jgi:hypothetical protein
MILKIAYTRHFYLKTTRFSLPADIDFKKREKKREYLEKRDKLWQEHYEAYMENTQKLVKMMNITLFLKKYPEYNQEGESK